MASTIQRVTFNVKGALNNKLPNLGLCRMIQFLHYSAYGGYAIYRMDS